MAAYETDLTARLCFGTWAKHMCSNAKSGELTSDPEYRKEGAGCERVYPGHMREERGVEMVTIILPISQSSPGFIRTVLTLSNTN